jgi:hypothetical protein
VITERLGKSTSRLGAGVGEYADKDYAANAELLQLQVEIGVA